MRRAEICGGARFLPRLCCAATCAVWCWAPARAVAEPADESLFIGVERVAGAYLGAHSDQHWGLLVLGSPVGVPIATRFRAAGDLQLDDRWTVGLAVAPWLVGTQRALKAAMLMPRAGVRLPLTDALTLWPRVGPTLLLGDIDASIGMIFDAPLCVSLGQHWGLTVGPTFDIGVGGAGRGAAYTLGLLSVGVVGWMRAALTRP